MVDVEQGALRTLEEDPPPFVHPLVQQQSGITQIRLEALRPLRAEFGQRRRARWLLSPEIGKLGGDLAMLDP